MSSASSSVTYTSVYTDSEPGRVFWGADEEISDGGSPRVIMYGYDGLPMQPEAPPSPDYIPSPKDPQTPPIPQDEDEYEAMFIQPHDPDYVSEPIYPEYIPFQDDHVFPVEEQPLPPVDSPTAEDDVDDEDGDEEEEEEPLALADSAVVILTVEIVSPPEGTKPVIPPPSTDISSTRARITGSALLGARPHLHFHHHHLCHHHYYHHLGVQPKSLPPETLRIASTQALVDAVTAALPSPPLPPLPPSLYIPPPIDRRDDIPESERPPHKRSCLFALGSRYEAGESSTARPT
ncbi:hypothetical protein Tco_1579077 [Tanacetum coccineum]